MGRKAYDTDKVTVIRLDEKPLTPKDKSVFEDYLEWKTLDSTTARYQEICTKYNGVPNTFIHMEAAWAYALAEDDLDPKMEILACFTEYSDVLSKLAVQKVGSFDDTKYAVFNHWGKEVAYPLMEVLGAIVDVEEVPETPISASAPVDGDDGTFPHFKGLLNTMTGMKLLADGSMLFLNGAYANMVGYIDPIGVVSLITKNNVTTAIGTAASIGLTGAVKMWRYDMARTQDAANLVNLPTRQLSFGKWALVQTATGITRLTMKTIRFPFELVASVSNALFRENTMKAIDAAYPTQEAMSAFLADSSKIRTFIETQVRQHSKNILPTSADDIMALFGKGLAKVAQSSAVTLGTKIATPVAAVYGGYHFTRSTDSVMDTIEEVKERISDGVKLAATTTQTIALGIETKAKEYMYNLFFYGVLGLAVLGLAGAVDTQQLAGDLVRTPLNTVTFGALGSEGRTRKKRSAPPQKKTSANTTKRPKN